MIKRLQRVGLCLAAVVLSGGCALGQAAPTAVGPRFFQGFTVPAVAGTLNYSFNATERLLFGYNRAVSNQINSGNTVSQTSLFANVGFLSGSEAYPVSLLYSGGYLINTSNQPSTFFHALHVTQGVKTKHWTGVFSDLFRYLPETPTSGLSGLAGVGNGGVPITPTGGGSGQGILTGYATRIQNTATANLDVPITGSTSLTGLGSFGVLRFPYAASAIENNLYTAGGGLSHRIDARNLVDGDYTYSHFKFLKLNAAFVTQDFRFGYTRHWSRKLTTVFSGGPQIIDSSPLTGNSASLNYSADLQATYLGSASTFSAVYIRATNSGSGVTYGARNDTARVTAAHKLSRQLTGSATLAYTHTQNVARVSPSRLSTSAYLGTLQINRAFTERINGFASYTLEHQQLNGTAAGVTPLNGLLQILGFGVSYSPRPIHIGHH